MIHVFGSSKSSKQSETPLSPKHHHALKIWRPRTPEEVVRKRHRRVVSEYLKRIGKLSGRDMSLDHDGVCVFTFKKFVIVVEVPEDSSNIVLFRSKISQFNPGDNHEQVSDFIYTYNHRKEGCSFDCPTDAAAAPAPAVSSLERTSPCGGLCTDHQSSCMRLEMEENEVNLVMCAPIQGLSFQQMADNLEKFIKTSVAANQKLGKLKALPLTPTELPQQVPGKHRYQWSCDSSQCSIRDMSQGSIFNLFKSSNTSTDALEYSELSAS